MLVLSFVSTAPCLEVYLYVFSIPANVGFLAPQGGWLYPVWVELAGPFHGGFAQHISGLQVVGIRLTQGRGPLSTWPFHISSFIPFKPFHCSYSLHVQHSWMGDWLVNFSFPDFYTIPSSGSWIWCSGGWRWRGRLASCIWPLWGRV